MTIQEFIKLREGISKRINDSIGELVNSLTENDSWLPHLSENIALWITESHPIIYPSKRDTTPCNKGVEYCFFCGEPDPEKLSVREIGISHPGSMCGDDYSFCFDCIASISAGEFLEKITSSV